MNILLVEPIKHEVVPLGLMKISTLMKSQGHKVYFQYGSGYFNNYPADEIYITTLFTWEYYETLNIIKSLAKKYPNAKIHIGGINASLLKDKYEQDLKYLGNRIKIHFGIIKEIEEQKPDYSLFPDIDYSVTYTTRGCINKCPYCMVPKLEGNISINKNWLYNIDISKPRIILFDNNFLACNIEHIKEVCKKLEWLDKIVDFNQGLEAKSFTEEKAKLMSNLKIHPLRFSYDREPDKPYIISAIKRAFNYNLNDISLYMLYNFLDKPEQIYERLNTITSLDNCNRVYIFMMRYQPLDTLEKSNYIGKYWTEELLKNFNNLRNEYFVNGIMRFNNKEHFIEVFGKNSEEFLKKIKGMGLKTHTLDLSHSFMR